MAVTKEYIDAEIKWYNTEINSLKENFLKWLTEQGHQVHIDEEDVIINEELSGAYKAKKFVFTIDRNLKFSLNPIGIWLVGARGRVDITGPSGKEKIVHLFSGGPGLDVEMKTLNGDILEKNYYQDFPNVISEDWYWYDDSSYRKVERISKEIVTPMLERIQ